MVRLRLTAQVIPERVFVGDETPSRPKQFREIVADPEDVTVGWLVNKLRHRYQTTFRQQLGGIKYVKDGGDVDIDLDMSPFDAFMNEGLAKKDGSDQDAIIKLITEGGLRLREGSVVPDLTPSKFKFDPPPPPPTWAQSQNPFSTITQASNAHSVSSIGSGPLSENIPEADRPIRSRERDDSDGTVRKRKRYSRGSPIIIQDSQPGSKYSDGALADLHDDSVDNEPKSESPELGARPRTLLPERSILNLPTTEVLSRGPEQATSPTQSRRKSPPHRANNQARSPSRSTSLTAGNGLRGDAQEKNRRNVPITPPSDNPQHTRSKSNFSNGKLSRPSCKIPTVEGTSIGNRAFSSRKGGNVYDVPESDIEDSQVQLAHPSNQKRKSDHDRSSSTNEDRPSKRPNLRSSVSVPRIRASEMNGILVDRHTRVLDGPRVPADKRPVHDFNDPDTLPDEYQSEGSESVSAQAEVDQQILNDSITQSNIDHMVQEPEVSISDAETESIPSQSEDSKSESSGLSKSAPKSAAESQSNVSDVDDAAEDDLSESVSEKENIEPTARNNKSLTGDDRGLHIGSTSRTKNGQSIRQSLKEVAIPVIQSSSAGPLQPLEILNGIRRNNEKHNPRLASNGESRSSASSGNAQSQSPELPQGGQNSDGKSRPESNPLLPPKAGQPTVQSKPAKGKMEIARDQAVDAQLNSKALDAEAWNSQTPQSSKETRHVKDSIHDYFQGAQGPSLNNHKDQEKDAGTRERSHSGSSEGSEKSRRMGLGITTSPSHRRTSSIASSFPSPSKKPRRSRGKASEDRGSRIVPHLEGDKDLVFSQAAKKAVPDSSKSQSSKKNEKPTVPGKSNDKVSRRQSSELSTSSGPFLPPGYSLERYQQQLASFDSTKAQASKTQAPKRAKKQPTSKSSSKDIKTNSAGSDDGTNQNPKMTEVADMSNARTTPLADASEKEKDGEGRDIKDRDSEQEIAPGHSTRVVEPTVTAKEVNQAKATIPVPTGRGQKSKTTSQKPTPPAATQDIRKKNSKTSNGKTTADNKNGTSDAESMSSVAKPTLVKKGNIPYKPPRFIGSSPPKQTDQPAGLPPIERLPGLTRMLREQQEAARRKAAEQERQQAQKSIKPSTTSSSSEDDDDSDDTESTDESDSDDNVPSKVGKGTPISPRVNVGQAISLPTQGPGTEEIMKATSSHPQKKHMNGDRTSTSASDENESADDTDIVKKDKTPPPTGNTPQKSGYRKLRFWEA